MNFSSEEFSLFLVFVLLFLIVLGFVKIARSLRKGGGSMITISLGATDQFYNKEKKETVAEIVNRKANKKMEEQESDEKKDKFVW
ncbi:MAG TPA: hypothetical protein ENH29_08980 [Bacteroidetes bacterium]|nr:hypothetical protein [Bacteroidota bacterium]